MATYTNKNGTNAADTLTYNKAGTYYAYAGNDTIKITGGTGVVVYTDAGSNTLTVSSGSGHTVKTAPKDADSDKINGEDKLNISGANIVDAYLGSGKDTITLANTDGRKSTGALATIHGGAWTDTFTTKAGAMRYQLYGDAGDDVFNVAGGDNLVFWGGAANDTFNVTGGTNIKLRGGDSADYYNIMADAVDMQLGYGNDTVAIEGGNNHKIKANLGINTISIMAGSGHVITADIDQAASKKAGRDVGYGQDNLGIYAAASQVTANLGDGRDTVTVSAGSKHEIYTEGWSDTIEILGVTDDSYFDSGAGDDIIKVSGGSYNKVEVGDGNDKVTVSEDAYLLKLSSSGTGRLTADIGKNAEVREIAINKGDAIINSASAKTTNLVLEQGAGTVAATLGSGDDCARINSKGSKVVMGMGNDEIWISASNNKVYGDYDYWFNYEQDSPSAPYNDTIHLETYAQGCYIDAGKGNNHIILNGTHSTVVAEEGNDIIEVKDKLGTFFSDLHNGGTSLEISTGAGKDTITVESGYQYGNYRYGTYVTVSGGLGDDKITFTKGSYANYLSAMSCVFGGSGNDTFNLETYGVVAYGGRGNDSFYCSDAELKGSNYLVGGAGSDTYTLDFSKGLVGNGYIIDNNLYHANTDKDVLKIVGFTGGVENMYLAGSANQPGLRALMLKDKATGKQAVLTIDGFDKLSQILLCDNNGNTLKNLGTGSTLETSLVASSRFQNAGLSLLSAESFLARTYTYYNKDYYDFVVDFVNNDSDLKLTGNAF